MQSHEKDQLRTLLNEVGGFFGRQEPYSDMVIDAYYQTLEPYPMIVIKRVLLNVLADQERYGTMPMPAVVREMCLDLLEPARRSGPPRAATHLLRCQHHDLDAPRGLDGERPQCENLVSWPPETDGPQAYYCTIHRSLYSGDMPVHEVERSELLDSIYADLLRRHPTRLNLRDLVRQRIASREAEGALGMAKELSLLLALITEAHPMPDERWLTVEQTAVERRRQLQALSQAEGTRWPKAADIWRRAGLSADPGPEPAGGPDATTPHPPTHG